MILLRLLGRTSLVSHLPLCRSMSRGTASAVAEHESLSQLARRCRQLYAEDSSEHGARLCSGLTALAEQYDEAVPTVRSVRDAAARFDFSPDVPANGYRSLVGVFDQMVVQSHATCTRLLTPGALRTRELRELVRDLEAWCQWMASMGVVFEHLVTLIGWSEGDSLFPDERHSPIELLKKTEEVNQYCFYGRMMGFQLDPTMRPVVSRITRYMCMYSHYFYNTGSSFRRWATASVFFRRIMNDPEYRAKRIVNISRYADIDFCKGFWSQQESEFVQMYPEVVGPSMAVNVTLGLPPEVLTLPAADGSSAPVVVQPPTAHIGPDSVHCRLLSAQRRVGMVGGGHHGKSKSRDSAVEPSPYLVFHCHGGGFVAQSSKSHEVYLREWAVLLDAPIFSIDYSLAPGAPFPRAVEEVFYAYCWALKHCALLGSTARRVVVVGDSAGGNLATTVTLEALKRGIRPPDAQLLIYTAFNVSFVPSAARLMCLMDPLLPLGFLMRCLHAYAGHTRAIAGQDGSDDDRQPTASGGAAAKLAGSCPPSAATSPARASYTLNPKRRRLGHRLANRDLDRLAADPLATEFEYFSLSADPRLSPFQASDELLARCPPTHILSCHTDPCLDDCVTMAKRWRRLGVPIGLTVLEGVCHGFLNFARFSTVAQSGSERCVQLLNELLHADDQ